MPYTYLAPLDFKARIAAVRKAYETARKVDLDESKTNRLTTFFGSTDIETRRAQITLLEKLCQLSDFCDDEDPDLYHMRMMVGVILCLKEQIKEPYYTRIHGYGELYDIIRNTLDTSPLNPMDNRTKYVCLYSLTASSLERVNRSLGKGSAIDPMEFKALKATANKLQDTITERFPLSRKLDTAGGMILKPAGIGLGWVISDLVAKSLLTSPVKVALTSAIGYVFLTVGPIAGAGSGAMYLLAREGAEKAVNIAVGVSGAMAGGWIAQRVGNAIGRATGFGLDVTIEASQKMYSALHEYITASGSNELHIGFDLAGNGNIMVQDSSGHLYDVTAVIEEARRKKDAMDAEEKAACTMVQLTPEQQTAINEAMRMIDSANSADSEVTEEDVLKAKATVDAIFTAASRVSSEDVKSQIEKHKGTEAEEGERHTPVFV